LRDRPADGMHLEGTRFDLDVVDSDFLHERHTPGRDKRVGRGDRRKRSGTGAKRR
jgi:hypothetical protein